VGWGLGRLWTLGTRGGCGCYGRFENIGRWSRRTVPLPCRPATFVVRRKLHERGWIGRRDSTLVSPCGSPSFRDDPSPRPFAVRRLGRLCPVEGRIANRETDSWPRHGSEPSAAARPAGRLFPFPFWPVKKGTPASDTGTAAFTVTGVRKRTFMRPTGAVEAWGCGGCGCLEAVEALDAVDA
jgi:hypothetical protein